MDPFTRILGLLPLICEFPYSRCISSNVFRFSTFIFASFFTVLPNGLTQTSYVLLTLHPRDLQPVGPTHTWPTTAHHTQEAVESNVHRHPYTMRWILTSTATPTPQLAEVGTILLGSYRTANLQMLHFIYLFSKYTY